MSTQGVTSPRNSGRRILFFSCPQYACKLATAGSKMRPTSHAIRRVSCLVSTRSQLRALAMACKFRVKQARPASSRAWKRKHELVRMVSRATCRAAFPNSNTGRTASSSKMLIARRAAPKHLRHLFSSMRACRVLPPQGSAASGGNPFLNTFREVQHAATGRFLSYSSDSAAIGSTRAFGGQSVVPWELALFLVEEMKAEMVQPGAVVYTAALAECRWAGEERHVHYLLQEMKAKGLKIMPGIPGATDDELPPSQAPPLFGKLPEAAPRSSGNRTQLHQPPSDSTAAAKSQRQSPATAGTSAAGKDAISAMQAAARTADAALATVETMWAREEHEPSAATCRAALDACAAGGEWERALSLVRDAAMAMAADADADADAEADADASANDGSVDVGRDQSVPKKVEALALEGRWSEALALVQDAGC